MIPDEGLRGGHIHGMDSAYQQLLVAHPIGASLNVATFIKNTMVLIRLIPKSRVLKPEKHREIEKNE